MDPVEIVALLGERWRLTEIAVEHVNDGLNSAVWRVVGPSVGAAGTAYLKSVPAEQTAELLAGAETARRLTGAGLRAGAPVTAASCETVVVARERAWTLLDEVPGRPLTASPRDLRDWGAALGRAHRLAPAETPDAGPASAHGGGDPFDWVPIELDPTIGPDWLRRATVRSRDELSAIPALTWVTLHTDPERGAFLRDGVGVVGIIDWTGSRPGPALYDLASAVMYAGGERATEPLIAAYREHGPVDGREIETHLRAFGRLRGVVQGLYFANRIARGDLTGLDDEGGDATGLADAEGMLRELGPAAG